VSILSELAIPPAGEFRTSPEVELSLRIQKGQDCKASRDRPDGVTTTPLHNQARLCDLPPPKPSPSALCSWA
jgi:hypothetical protein